VSRRRGGQEESWEVDEGHSRARRQRIFRLEFCFCEVYGKHSALEISEDAAMLAEGLHLERHDFRFGHYGGMALNERRRVSINSK